jgi:drug/metabolite transporter (DMT)-like permease
MLDELVHLHMSKELKGWLLLLLLACIWGSSFILMKKGMFANDGSPIFSDTQVGSLRMLIASLVLLPFGLKHLKHIKNFKQLLSLSIVGFFGNFFPAFLFTYSETGISSGFAGMLNSFTPIFTVLIGYFIFKVKLTPIQLIGILIGTVGIYFLMAAGKSISKTGNWSHIIAVVVATLFYGISLNTIKHTLQQFSAIQITSLAFTVILPPSLIATYGFGTFSTIRVNPHALDGLLYISILSIIGTALAVVLFNRIISVRSALFASSVTYFIPVVAVIIGYFFKEQIGYWQVVAMFIILAGVILVNLGPLLLKRKESEKKIDFQQ